MSIKAKLFFCSEERELLHTNIDYYRLVRWNGKPATQVMGGYITVTFPSEMYDDSFLETMLADRYENKRIEYPYNLYQLRDGKVVFYKEEIDGQVFFEYNFKDATIIEYREEFDNQNGMYVTLTISPAIQDYRFFGNMTWEEKSPTRFVKTWEENYIPPKKETPYKSKENNTEKKEDDFGINIKILKDKTTFTPFGIPNYEGIKENANIEFEIEIAKNDIDDFEIEIICDNQVIKNYYSSKQRLKEVVITGKSSNKSSNIPPKNNEKEAEKNYPVGFYKFKWNGFDKDNIFDSTTFINKKIKARVIGKRNGMKKTAESNEFSFEYNKVQWVDVKINNNTKRIDVTLRVNLKDGGARGIECNEQIVAPDPIIISECPWDKIPKKNLIAGKPPLKTRIKTFKDLEKLALDGLNYHWGRNRNHFVAKNVDINGVKYEIFVNAVNTTKNAIAPLSTKFVTNGSPGRSRNWELSRILYFNIGYLDFSSWYNLSSDWKYRNLTFATDLFKETSAHEIGHEVLLAYGGHIYSKKHKETSTILQSENAGLKYPLGEIDLMKYYDEEYAPDFRKVIASEKDVCSLIWLTKLELK